MCVPCVDDCLLHGVIRLAITFFAVYRIKILKHWKQKKRKLIFFVGNGFFLWFGVIRLALRVIRLGDSGWFAGVIRFSFRFSWGKGTRLRGCAWVCALAPGRVCACAYVPARVCVRVCVTRVCVCARGCGKNVTPLGWVWYLCIPVAKTTQCCKYVAKLRLKQTLLKLYQCFYVTITVTYKR